MARVPTAKGGAGYSSEVVVTALVSSTAAPNILEIEKDILLSSD
jgi:hypothetical protein